MRDKINLTMMIGLPASGRSTVAKRLADGDDSIIISSDKIREGLFGDEAEQGDPKLIFEKVHELILDSVSNGRNVIFDATNISYKHRASLLQKLNKYTNLYKKAVLVAAPWSEIIVNNETRSRVVPKYTISRMVKNFFAPFWGEGWDDINIIWNTRMTNQEIVDGYSMVELFSMTDKFNQDNPHHTLTLGEHCRLVQESLKDDNLLEVVGALHDMGKLWTKDYRDAKGDASKTAHYYNHENVGAYMSLYFLKAQGYSDSFIIDAVTRIQFHMRPYGLKTDKARNKLIHLVGKDVYSDLLTINNADRLAH